MCDGAARHFDESVVGQEEAIGENWDKLNEPGKAALVEGGAEVHIPTDEEKGPFVAAGEEMTMEVLAEREKVNPDARKVYELMKKAAAKYAN